MRIRTLIFVKFSGKVVLELYYLMRSTIPSEFDQFISYIVLKIEAVCVCVCVCVCMLAVSNIYADDTKLTKELLIMKEVYSYQKNVFPNVSDNVVLLLDFRKGYSEEVVQTQEDKQLKI